MIQEKTAYNELEKTIEQLSSKLTQRSEELAVINSIQEALAKKMEMQEIYDLVGDRTRDLFDAQAVIIATLDKENEVENFKYTIENGERFYLNPRPLDKLRHCK